MTFFPPLAMREAGRIDELFAWATVLTGVAFATMVALLLIVIVRDRARGRTNGDYLTGETPRTFAGTLAFALLVFFGIDVHLALRDHAAWAEIYDSAPTNPTLRVEIRAKRFEWLVRYAGEDDVFGTEDDATSVNRIVVPVGRTVEAAMTSQDVIHSFFVPHVRLKQDVLPGMVTRMRFRIDREGEFDIACAELCGFAHYAMRGAIVAVSGDAFSSMLRDGTETGVAPNWGWRWE